MNIVLKPFEQRKPKLVIDELKGVNTADDNIND